MTLVAFCVPTVVLSLALLVKLPTIIRLWRDPQLRAVGGLLLLACAVFVCCSPAMIARVNALTGVPNVAAPLCYSLITAMSGSCLLLIITWRSGPSGRSTATRRVLRWVTAGYAALIAVQWPLFLLADVPVERVRDLDTYYARTPFMREEILLYLLAHGVACVIACRLLRNWVRADGLDAWLRWGLKLLGGAYGLSLVFSAAKLTAVVARWCGRDADWLSTDVAPPVASLSAILVAAGVILSHTGPYLHGRWLVHLTCHELRPLYRLMRTTGGPSVPFTLRASPELRLTRRETFIRDVLLSLSRFLDRELGARAYEAALSLGHPPERARALAAAVAVTAATERRHTGTLPSAASPYLDPTVLLREIGPVSRALRRREDLAAIRRAVECGVRVGGDLSGSTSRP
ncbi:hypothetical protein NX794_08920 [Streptomyces sp. LP11]|uniref:DUF6545 domain-containing protein n=1 Tax=Streptomyces pyxinicus TaxID=2970331 RepID=A0ABT2AYZ5_9ACTN|nr:DUF6545 domain-containing protein [Streptomyces sp. LP11]MCS0601351.1 hypothetical protein [Streptomyces sp. LP11]